MKTQLNTVIEQILYLLKEEYGMPDKRPISDPVSVLVQTILSQNTSDSNSRQTFSALFNTFGSWENVAHADNTAIENAIRHGGLGRVKAEYIKQALKEIQVKRGRLELDFLSRLDLPEARDWLEQLPGVGIKTASCVLLFSLGMPALPVDTHILRVAKRLRLIASETSSRQAHHLLAEMVPPEAIYPFHILTIEHGRRVCQAKRPLCRKCVLKEICPPVSRKQPDIASIKNNSGNFP